jgi:hypothetical protein
LSNPAGYAGFVSKDETAMMIRKITLTIMNFVLFGSPVTGQANQKELTRTHAYVQDAKPAQPSKSLEGEWKGTLGAGGQKLRLLWQ